MHTFTGEAVAHTQMQPDLVEAAQFMGDGVSPSVEYAAEVDLGVDATQPGVEPTQVEAVTAKPGFLEIRMDNLRNGRDERGSFMIPVLTSIARRKGAEGGGRGPKRKGLLIAGAAVMATAMSCQASGSFSASADLNKADMSAHFYNFKWVGDASVAPSTLFYESDVDGQDIVMDINDNVCIPTPWGKKCHDLYPPAFNPKLNVEVNGPAQNQLLIPLDAISATEQNGKLNVTTDWSKITARINYVGNGPTVNFYTIHNGKKNPGDEQGFRLSFLKGAADALRVLNLDTVGNTVDGLSTNIVSDEKQRGLDAAGECTKDPTFITAATPEVKTAVLQAIQLYAKAPSVASFNLSNTDKSLIVDTGKVATDALGDGTFKASTYSLASGKFDLKVDCGNVSAKEPQ